MDGAIVSPHMVHEGQAGVPWFIRAFRRVWKAQHGRPMTQRTSLFLGLTMEAPMFKHSPVAQKAFRGSAAREKAFPTS